MLLADDPTYKVVGITDGDTITVIETNNEINKLKVRLAEIDAPEKKQPYGTKSKEILSEKIFDKSIRLEILSKDRYGRTIGNVFLGERNINLEMVEDGAAWQYVQFSKSTIFKTAQNNAMNKKIGLWEEKAVAPWEFRKKGKN